MSNQTCRIDFSSSSATLRPLHGVNCGPIVSGGVVDLSPRFRELKIPSVRVHDCNWPHPWEIDIPTIFPDFSADAESTDSYDFRRTDNYVNSIIQTGADIIYRLGVSIEHTPLKYFTAPPIDFEQWATICRHIVMHYNDGWADGFHLQIRYWEVWNEPDVGDLMWSGTQEEYFRLYAVTARELKTYDPSMKIGGPASASCSVEQGILPAFIAYCCDHHLPLDFLSWHLYTDDPRNYLPAALAIRKMLDAHGYTHTENHCNEWHYMVGDWPVIMDPSYDGREKRLLFDKLNGAEGAAFVAYSLLAWQQSPIDVANYYTADTMWWGLFDHFGDRRKTYYAFLAFKRLLETPRLAQVESSDLDDRLVICAGLSDDGQFATMLLCNFNAPAHTLHLELNGLPWDGATKCSVSCLDARMNLDLSSVKNYSTCNCCIEENLPPATVLLYRLEKLVDSDNANASPLPADSSAFADVTFTNGNNYALASFRYWQPAELEAIRGVLVLTPGAGGDGRDDVLDAGWQQFSRQHSLALIGSYITDYQHESMRAEEYARASDGSGQALLDALDIFAQRSGHGELTIAPLLLWGFSAGGQFNYEMACWAPERILAFVANKGGIYYTHRARPATLRVPGLFIIGEQDEQFRIESLRGLFAVNRIDGARWTLAIEPGAGHEYGVSRELAAQYFDAICRLRLTDQTGVLEEIAPSQGWIGDLHTLQIRPDDEGMSCDALSAWLPEDAFAQTWREFVLGIKKS